MNKIARVPKKGAGRRLAQKLKELGQQKPPQTLIDKINGDEKKKVAAPTPSASKDVEI
ncbi:MAG: hypothetical protein M9899_09105 [Bdellovibrionaceae bacterium]|nr:hypothetical protein [Pseudobdellovibrionaceae bacterium]